MHIKSIAGSWMEYPGPFWTMSENLDRYLSSRVPVSTLKMMMVTVCIWWILRPKQAAKERVLHVLIIIISIPFRGVLTDCLESQLIRNF